MSENVEVNLSKNRVRVHNTILRVPTILFTFLMVGTLVIYFLVSVSFGSTLDVPNFILLGTMEVVTYYLYFPDGQLKGQNSDRFINNKTSYNTKASKVNQKRQIKNLQEYCIVEYKDRIKEYIETQMGYCDLDYNDYLWLRDNMTYSQFKHCKEIVVNDKSVYLDKSKRKRLKNVLYKKLPIEANNSRTILSAVETNSQAAIRDQSKKDKMFSQFRMALKVLSIAFFSGYMLVTAKDGFNMTTLAMFVLDLFAIMVVAITSYMQGEINQKTYKANFYMDLAIFLDNFYEWLLLEKSIDIDTYTPLSYLKKQELEKKAQEQKDEQTNEMV